MSEDIILQRPSVPELDAILGKKFKVLDDGFIRLVDYMGSDASIVQAARVSYGAGTKQVSEDRGLIRYLMRHYHTTPFEMCELKLHVRVPMDAWRQWIRHRMASVNEYSTRYSIAIDAAQQTAPSEWRYQSADNKQGSAGFMADTDGQYFSNQEKELHKAIRNVYDERLEKGIAREQARKDLPLSTYTEAYWKIDLHNLLHFLALRMDSHAQYEIRAYAEIIGQQIVSKWCPFAWEAFMDYRFNAQNFSEIELKIISMVAAGDHDAAKAMIEDLGLLKYRDGKRLRNRERSELEEKLSLLNLPIPWRD
ncbi:MAG: FAD-dependent thymidylate synthase [Calditrichae bacterium]|nr:FAD-dependent thymidylate synthase [Calditrichota bacterium]MCB9057558.1 FAD-dependent thymidylate synthase [Calditrichia bacterium]